MVNLKKEKACFGVNKRKEIYNSIGEKLATILGDLHLILIYYKLHHPHALFQPVETKINVSIYKTI